MHTVDDLIADLQRLGLGTGDTVIVHASLRRIGPVDGGAEATITALDRAVGPDGTVMMVLGARDDFDWVNQHPPEDRASLLAEAPTFDPLRTPADPDVGMLAEVFRQMPGTVVGNHPDGRFGARGTRAVELVAGDLPWDDYYGAGSPLERLVEAGGKVLRMGADPDTVTLLHYVEWLADLPDKRRVVRHHKVLDDTGEPVIRAVATLDDSNGIVDYPDGDYFVDILTEFLATGQARVGTVGSARSELFDAADMVEFATEWMNRAFRGG